MVAVGISESRYLSKYEPRKPVAPVRRSFLISWDNTRVKKG